MHFKLFRVKCAVAENRRRSGRKLFLGEIPACAGSADFLFGAAYPPDISDAIDHALFPGEVTAAYSAGNFACERIIRMNKRFSAPDLRLHSCVGFPTDDCLVRVGLIIHGKLPRIPDFLLGNRVGNVALLPQNIASIDLVLDHLMERRLLKQAAVDGPVSRAVQLGAYIFQRNAVKIQGEHFSDDFRFFRNDDILSFFFIVTITERMLVRRTNFTRFESFADAPFAVFRNAAAFLLREGRKDGKHQFSFAAQRVNLLLLKTHLDAEAFQPPDRVEQVYRVAGKPLYGFGENDVNIALFAFP